MSPHSHLPVLLLPLLVLLALVTPTSLFFATALELRSATLRTHIIGLDGSLPGRVTNVARSSASTPVSVSSELTGAKLGVLTLEFDAAPWVTRLHPNDTNTFADDSAHPPTTLPVTEASSVHMYGLIRLICGHDLIDSHPPKDDGALQRSENLPTMLPGFLLLTPGESRGPWMESWPLLGLVEDELEMDEGTRANSTPASHTLRAFLVLASSRHGEWVSRISTRLDQCEVRVLPRSSQSWLPTGVLHDATNPKPCVARHRVRLIESTPMSQPSRAHSIAHDSILSHAPLPKSTPLSHGNVRNLLRTIVSTRQRTAAFLETQTASRSMIQVDASAETGVKFAGILKGLIGSLLSGLADPMGNQIGEFTAEGVLDPIAEKVLDGVSDSLQTGMSAYATGDIVVQIIPGICETVTAALTESTARAIAESVVRGTTETITTDVTTRVTHTIVDPATLRSSQIISVKLARMLHNSLTHVLSRSIPHIIVPSLLNTVSVGLKEDYYCYFCATKQMYCIYCNKNRGDTATRLYYALYYTSFHSTYYSNWYSSQKKFGVLMLQKRQMHPLDEVDDEDEKAWDIIGREGEDGTQAEPTEEAKVITKPELEGQAPEGGEGGEGGEAAGGGEGAEGAEGGAEGAEGGADGAVDAAGGGDEAAAGGGLEEALGGGDGDGDGGGGLAGALGGGDVGGGGGLGGLGDQLKGALQGGDIKGAIGGLKEKIGGMAKEKLAGAMGKVQGKLQEVQGKIAGKIGEVQGKFGGVMEKAGLGQFTDKLNGAFDKVNGKLNEGFGKIDGKMQEMQGKVDGAIDKFTGGGGGGGEDEDAGGGGDGGDVNGEEIQEEAAPEGL